MKTILRLITWLGFFLLIGTAGAGDINFIDIRQILNQSLLSVCLIVSSCWGIKHIEEKEEKRRRERRMRRAELYPF